MKISRKQQMQYENFKHFVYESFMVKLIYECTVVVYAVL